MANITKFSKIIAGTMTWGSWGKQLQKKEIINLMQHCFELGITTFDHADIYGGYTTEQDFGNAFKNGFAGIWRNSHYRLAREYVSRNLTSPDSPYFLLCG